MCMQPLFLHQLASYACNADAALQLTILSAHVVSVYPMQVSKVVQKFYECLMRGEEYTDDAWEVWEKSHPADVAARSPQKSGAAMGGGRGNCFKCVSSSYACKSLAANSNNNYDIEVLFVLITATIVVRFHIAYQSRLNVLEASLGWVGC